MFKIHHTQRALQHHLPILFLKLPCILHCVTLNHNYHELQSSSVDHPHHDLLLSTYFLSHICVNFPRWAPPTTPPPPYAQLTPWHSWALELLSLTTVAASSSLRSLFHPQPPKSVTLPPLHCCIFFFISRDFCKLDFTWALRSLTYRLIT